MKIATLNINGYRAGLKKGLAEWLEKNQPDVLCLQEIKIFEHQADVAAIEALGYHHHWFSAEKAGYSGVATFCKMEADAVVKGTGMEAYDIEGRILRTDFGPLTVVNAYFPSGSSSEGRHDFKMQFLADIRPWFDELRKERQELIVCGDYNIVHLDIDIHNPERKDNPSGFRPEERAWLDDWFDGAFVDAFRALHPDAREYSWWSYRAGSRGKNKGWRIDYISVTPALADRIRSAGHHKDPPLSDHCPVVVSLG